MSDLMREQFEEYAEETGFDLSFYFFDDDKMFAEEDTRLAFEIYKAAWKASRAVEIELPVKYFSPDGASTNAGDSVRNMTIEACIYNIREAGFKIKE
jgi:hypothetical protein